MATQHKFRANDHDLVLTVPLTAAADCVDRTVFTMDRPYQLRSVSEVHAVLGSDGSAVSLDVKKCTGTQAPSAGTTVLGATKIDLKGTINTVQSPALTATAANLLFATGDRLAHDVTGTPTAVAGGVVTYVLRPTDVK